MAAFSPGTISRLHAVLTVFVPASAATLLTAGFLGQAGEVGGATLVLMGTALGSVAGMSAGLVLKRYDLREADYRLPFVVGLLGLLLAMVPVQSDILSFPVGAARGWGMVLGTVLAGVPLGVAMGSSWVLWKSAAQMESRARLRWGALGLLLGSGLAGGAVAALFVFKGAALVNLFAAPLVWPTLPSNGDRSLLARMLLTLIVLLSTMFLLFS